MNPYIGDRQLEPDEQEEPCAKCGDRHCDRECPDESLEHLNDLGEANDYPEE